MPETSPEDAAQDAKRSIENGLDSAHAFLKRQIEERPVAVLVSALGAGLLLGALMSRGRR